LPLRYEWNLFGDFGIDTQKAPEKSLVAGASPALVAHRSG
jgi:hypothetical protein